MTSWIRTGPAKKKDPVVQEFYWTPTPTSITESFNSLLYAVCYSFIRSKKLNVNPVNTLIGTNFDGIRSALVDIPKVSYVTDVKANYKQIKQDAEYYQALSLLSEESIRAVAAELFTWNVDMQKRCENARKEWGMPDAFDLGVHIRTPRRVGRGAPTLSVASYINAVRAHQVATKKKKLDIFIMTDNSQLLDEFQRAADSSWTIYNLPSSARNLEGFSPEGYSGLSRSQRIAAFYEFVTELMIMQSVETVITTLSSNTGRFLYITSDPTHKYVSLDEKEYKPYYLSF
jgi:hypothetical protein